MIDRIACLLVSFVDAQSKLDHAVDPLGVHSRLLIQKDSTCTTVKRAWTSKEVKPREQSRRKEERSQRAT